MKRRGEMVRRLMRRRALLEGRKRHRTGAKWHMSGSTRSLASALGEVSDAASLAATSLAAVAAGMATLRLRRKP